MWEVVGAPVSLVCAILLTKKGATLGKDGWDRTG